MAKKTAFLLHYDMLENLKLLGNDVAVEVLTALSLHDQGRDIGTLSPHAQFAVNSYLPALNKAKNRWKASVINGGGDLFDDLGEPSHDLEEASRDLGEPSHNLEAGVLVPVLVPVPVTVPEEFGGSEEPPPPPAQSVKETGLFENREETGGSPPGGILGPQPLSETPQDARKGTAVAPKAAKTEPDTIRDDSTRPRGDTAETALVPARSRSPPAKSKKRELNPEQLALFRVAKACFEACEKTRALMYQDGESAAREMKNLKTLVIRCTNIAPGFSADFLRNVLEHFRVMCGGRLRGRAGFTPRSLTTSWIWELVIESLPEAESPELKEFMRGLFK